MSATELMKMAAEAESKVSHYESLNAASGVDRWQIDAKINYYLGQASGFRQAAWFVAQLTGENAND